MAYNQNNLLNEIEEVQQIYSKHIQEGVTAEFIFNNYIKNIYHISRTTFFTYLKRNVAKERRLLKEKEDAKRNSQPTLFDMQ
ncbi:hypothetical protein CAP35_13940 [Chitinophagaceae bacterium IBVUCB1]|nr:hypothetical protein CAP35_13940 [Chitinophagaceae bacterium IBVUCB1]